MQTAESHRDEHNDTPDLMLGKMTSNLFHAVRFID